MKCEWKEVELSEVADLTVGFVGTMASHYTDNGVLFLRSTNIEPFNIKMDDVKYISPEFNETIKKSQLNPDDVVIVRTGKPGACTVIPQKTEPWNCSDLVIIHPNKEKINPLFLASYINLASGVINAHLVGAVQQHFNVGTAKKMKIPLPSIDVQNRIASIIQGLNDKIELNNKINENLLEQMQLLYQGLLTNCDCSLIRLEDIAQKIAMGPFGSNIKVSTFVSEGVPIISGNHLRSVFLEEPSYNFITEEHAQKLKNSIVYPRDIIFTHAGNIGQVAMIPNGCDYTYYMISQRQFYMRCDETKVVPELVLFFFHSREGKGKLLANANSTGVPSIAQPSTHLKNIEMPLPNKKDQDTWYKVIRPMVDEYVALCQENKRIAALRDRLLPKLMNGEIDIDGI